MAARVAHEYGCVFACLPSDLAARLIAYGAKIPDEVIYLGDNSDVFGREVESHVTVKYGLRTDDADAVAEVVGGFGPVEVRVTGVSVFDNPDYVVLKADVEGERLRDLYHLISDNFECDDDYYPDYKPHVTIAYLKRPEDGGAPVDEYLTDEFDGDKFTFDEVWYSAPTDVKTKVSLLGGSREAFLGRKIAVARTIQRLVIGAKMQIIEDSVANSIVGRRDRSRGLVNLEKREKRFYRSEQRDAKEWGREAAALARHLLRDDGAATILAKRVKEEKPGRGKSVWRSRHILFAKEARNIPEITAFLDHVAELKEGKYVRGALEALRDAAFGRRPRREVYADLRKIAIKHFEQMVVELDRDVPLMDAGYTEELLEFFPKSIGVRVDGSGKLEEMVSHFDAMVEIYKVKARKQVELVERYNEVVAQVKRDMKSSDPDTRLLALMLGITMETGLRPGSEGAGLNVRDPESGEEVWVDTFGVTTLKRGHVAKIRDDFVKVQFPGKKGAMNVGEVRDSDIVKGIARILNGVDAKGNVKGNFLFVSKDGSRLTDAQFRAYISSRWSDLSPYDFRRLKATSVVFDRLKSSVEGLMLDIRREKEKAKGNLEDKVVDMIVASLGEAYSKAQAALSHEDVSVTIDKYVNPQVVMAFLSSAGLPDTLDDLLLEGGAVEVRFNVHDFIERAVGKKLAAPVVEVQLVQGGERGIEDSLEEAEDFVEAIS